MTHLGGRSKPKNGKLVDRQDYNREMKKGLKAWLITWEWSGDHAKAQVTIAEILNPRTPPKRVREIVELPYHGDALLSEKLAWRLRKQSQPYAAEFTRVSGVRWLGEITCGHNPWLRARLVNDLVATTDADKNEIASWTEALSVREVSEKVLGVQN